MFTRKEPCFNFHEKIMINSNKKQKPTNTLLLNTVDRVKFKFRYSTYCAHLKLPFNNQHFIKYIF